MQVAEINQFGSAKPARSGIGASCAQCEAMLTDAIDGTLSAADKAAFDRHIETCDVCSEMLADAQRGAALLGMLKQFRPEPSATLLDRILAQTSGVQSASTQASGSETTATALGLVSGANAQQVAVDPVTGVISLPASMSGVPGAFAGAKVLPFTSRVTKSFNLRSFGHAMLQPRLAMTAAMAFFSVALTLNLTGVHLNELRANDLKPANLKRNLYESGAHMVRYYDNLRVVYELESRVHDLQRDNDVSTPAAQKDTVPSEEAAPDKQPKQNRPKPGSGTSERQNLFHPGIKLVRFEQPSHQTSSGQLSSTPFSPKQDLSLNGSYLNKFKDLASEGGLV